MADHRCRAPSDQLAHRISTRIGANVDQDARHTNRGIVGEHGLGRLVGAVREILFGDCQQWLHPATPRCDQDAVDQATPQWRVGDRSDDQDALRIGREHLLLHRPLAFGTHPLLSSQLGGARFDHIDACALLVLHKKPHPIAGDGSLFETTCELGDALHAQFGAHGRKSTTNCEDDPGDIVGAHAIIIVCRGSSLMSRGSVFSPF